MKEENKKESYISKSSIHILFIIIINYINFIFFWGKKYNLKRKKLINNTV